MSKVPVVYWSGTGNTEIMASLVGKGIEEGGKEVMIVSVSDISPETLKEFPAFALGCPSMGAEVLEEGEMEPFVESIESFVQGKKIGLFGSYGWGDGEWMRNWVERMSDAGANVVGDEGVIANGAPDKDAEERCKELGKALAK